MSKQIGSTGIEAVGMTILDNQNLIAVLSCAGQMPTSRFTAQAFAKQTDSLQPAVPKSTGRWT